MHTICSWALQNDLTRPCTGTLSLCTMFNDKRLHIYIYITYRTIPWALSLPLIPSVLIEIFSVCALRFLELRRWYSFAANSTIAGNSFWWGGDPKHILLLESPYRSRSRFYWLAWLILATGSTRRTVSSRSSICFSRTSPLGKMDQFNLN